MSVKKRAILKNSYTQRKVKHKPSGYSLSLICSFDETKNRHKFYRKKDCIKKICNDLKELATETINYELLLRKGVYPYEYMDSSERFDETSLPPKKDFYSELNLEDITDKDYEHAQNLREVFGIKNLDKYHNLYIQSNTLLLADVFENFRDKFIEIYELDPAHFLSAPRLAWQACLKRLK